MVKYRILFDQGQGAQAITCKECGSEDVRGIGVKIKPLVGADLKRLDLRCQECDLISSYRWTARTKVWLEERHTAGPVQSHRRRR